MSVSRFRTAVTKLLLADCRDPMAIRNDLLNVLVDLLNSAQDRVKHYDATIDILIDYRREFVKGDKSE